MGLTKQKVPRTEEVFKNLAKGDKQTKEDIILLRRFLGYPEDLLSVGLDDMEAYHKSQQFG